MLVFAAEKAKADTKVHEARTKLHEALKPHRHSSDQH